MVVVNGRVFPNLSKSQTYLLVKLWGGWRQSLDGRMIEERVEMGGIVGRESVYERK